MTRSRHWTGFTTISQALLAQPDTVKLDLLRDSIISSAGFGVAGAVPLSRRRDACRPRDAAHVRPAQSKKSWPSASHNSRRSLPVSIPAQRRAEEKRNNALARLAIVFGKAFVVLPRFAAANAAELQKALNDSEKVQDGDPLASTTWFQRMARVRGGVARLNQALSYAEAIGSGEKLSLSIAQLPYVAGDRWVGLPLKDGRTLPGGKLSLVVLSGTPVDVSQPLAGLLVDEWVEVVPNAKETTGIALQYDQPDAAPPQTILIAVPPELDVPWTVWSLQQVLLETLDLARIRCCRLRRAGRSRALPARVVLCVQHIQRNGFDRLHCGQVEGTMSSITSWMRLEPQSRNAEMNTSLQARIYDPLWLLARQWQLGEFQGEDNGSPVMASWRGESGRLMRYHSGPIAPNSMVNAPSYDPRSMPLETLVERETIRPTPGQNGKPEKLRLAAQAGQQFLRMLDQQPLSSDYRAAFIRQYPFPELTPEQRVSLDSESLSFLDLVGSRVPDGRRLYTEFRSGGAGGIVIAPELQIAPGDLAEVEKAARLWMQWFEKLFSEPETGNPTWLPERLEYAFSVGTRLDDGERVLTAQEYSEGHLDWYDFDMNLEVTLGGAADNASYRSFGHRHSGTGQLSRYAGRAVLGV